MSTSSAHTNASDHFLASLPLIGTLHMDTLLLSWSVMAIILLVSFLITKNLKVHRLATGQFILEGVYDLWAEQISSQISKAEIGKHLPLIGGIFCFTTCAYWTGILPWETLHAIFPQIGHIKPPTVDINIPAAMAVLALVNYLVIGVKSAGGNYMLSFLGIHMSSGKAHIDFGSIVTAFIEWLDLISRPVTLALRLFANGLAGEALLSVVFKICPIVLPVVILAFELGIGLLQAFIFAMLALVYAAMARKH